MMSNNTLNQPENLDANLEIREVAKIADSPILKNSSDGIVMGDLWGYISDVNQVIIDLFGAKDKKEFVGKHVLNFLVKEERQRAIKESMDSIINSKSKTLKYCVQLKNGQQLTLIVKTMLMKDENGQQTGFVNIVKTDS
jgi:PAS domain S-box-containing protein